LKKRTKKLLSLAAATGWSFEPANGRNLSGSLADRCNQAAQEGLN
jgi:hypothetical protein